LFVGLLIAFALSLLAWPAAKHRSSTCHTPLQRREWRTLQPSEHQEYIDAVLCLSSQASIFEPGSSRYDDFTYAHVFEGANTAHYAAAFLPWHRYFIHLLEKALRYECGFSGILPYWDWALDSEDIGASPVWDPVEGFGGDGDFSSPGPELFEGRCVVEGPFTNATRHWEAKSEETGHGYDLFASQHCLSRGFDTSSEKQEVFRSHISPAAIDALLNLPNYAEFIDKLEVKAHNTIPLFVRGDFLGLSAPNGRRICVLHSTYKTLTESRSRMVSSSRSGGQAMVAVAAAGSGEPHAPVSWTRREHKDI
jgi:tyrosinase